MIKLTLILVFCCFSSFSFEEVLVFEESYKVLELFDNNNNNNINDNYIDNVEVQEKIADPDIGRTTPEFITSRGFVAEIHHVVTSDGYILELHRIVNRKIDDAKKHKRPIILQHGLGGSSADYVFNSPGGHVDEPLRDEKGHEIVGNNLGFELAKRGFDVWLSNVRGNLYSTNHTTLDPTSREFWEFSIDEHVEFDIPAIIDNVLKSTNSTKVSYVGHSQGTTVMFALLSSRPEYQKIIEPFVALAPVAHVTFIYSPLRVLANDRYLSDLLLLKGGPLLPDAFFRFLTKLVCTQYGGDKLCENILFFFGGGWDSPQLNSTRLAVYGGDESYGTSSKNIVHWGQLVRNKWFKKFDYGFRENLKKYGRPDPPEYSLEQIDPTNIALFYSLNDNLGDPKDVTILKNRLKGQVLDDYLVPYELWNHLDFVIGIDAGKFINSRILDILKKYPF